ncbi:MAG: MarR family winged helix-turn-helix transcriptional regulator [Acidimicrobiia bacterium]
MTEQRPAVDRDVLTLAWLARVLERACTDLTLPQYRLLALIARGDERASDVAARLALARPTVSATIDTLVERGVLERTAIDTDRRAVRLTITAEGYGLMRTAQDAMRERLDDVLTRAADPSLVQLALDQLAVALTAAREENRTKSDTASTKPEAAATT